MTHKILVPVDGSECALRALGFAAERAKGAPGTSLHVLTVHPEVWCYGELAVYVGKERLRQLAAEHDKDVLGKAEALLAPLRVLYTTESLEGDPAERIVQRATELGCESIIMGTRGLGRLGTLILGSVANKVIHSAAMPVTLVK